MGQRQNPRPNSAIPLMESYTDFSGGLNSEISNDKLKDNECTVLENVDLQGRASAKARYGRTEICSTYPWDTATSVAQGMFFFYQISQTTPDIIVAVSGKLYVKPYGSAVFTQIAVTDNGSPFTFQTTLSVEGVQYRQTLFVATGTKLVEVNYTGGAYVANTVAPYKPTVQEVINLGSNSIASDPATWIQDTTAAVVNITGIIPSIAQAAVKTAVTFTAKVAKPEKVDVNYTLSWRKTGAGLYTDILTNSPLNYADITFQDIGGYDIKADTKKVFYGTTIPWTGAQTGLTQIQGNSYDGQAGHDGHSLILYLSGTSYDTTQDLAWYDFATPMDMTKADTVEWYWTQYSQPGDITPNPAGTIKFKFYTEGNLTTPVITVQNSNSVYGRSSGGTYSHEVQKYNNTVSGADKIVRMAVYGAAPQSSYIPNTDNGIISPSDSSLRIDTFQIYMDGTETTYVKENYQVAGIVDPTVDPESYSAIHTSRMIRLHVDRLLLAKDNKYPGQIYISHLYNPRYFPTGNRIDFSLDKQEPVTAIVRYRDMHVVFTKTAVHTLTGTSPADYKRTLIHDGYGCIADRTAKVVDNEIFFLSSEGIYKLKPNLFFNTLETMNVSRIDLPIKSEIALIANDPNACAVATDYQYWINFPSTGVQYRLYYDKGVWVKDTSKTGGTNPLKFSQFLQYGDTVYNLTTTGRIYEHDKTVFTDNGDEYTMIVESKFLDLSASFNSKSIKRLHVLAKNYQEHTVDLSTTVQADAAYILTPETGMAIIDPVTNLTTWQKTIAPNIHFSQGSQLGSWKLGTDILGNVQLSSQRASIRGKCKRIKVRFEYSGGKACEIYGFALEFKLKKP